MPARFLAVGASHDLMEQIDDWVLDQATTQLQSWVEAGTISRGPFVMSVNLSSLRLQQPQFAADLLEMLADKSLSPGMLRLEIREETLRSQPELVSLVLARLHAGGVQIALDNFGQGLSALQTLRTFPFTCLKIDRSLVQGHKDLESRAFLRSLFAMAKALGLQTIAEGVETMEQSRICQEFGADLLQGYLYCEPSGDPKMERSA